MKLPLIYIAIVLTQVEIPEDTIVPNRSPGYCSWCNLETLGKHHGLVELTGLVDRKQQLKYWCNKDGKWIENGGARISDLSAELKRLHIDHVAQENNKSPDIIKNACVKKLGCIAHVIDYPNQGDAHSIIVTNWSESDSITFIDPNNTSAIYRCSYTWFEKHWIGSAITIDNRRRQWQTVHMK